VGLWPSQKYTGLCCPSIVTFTRGLRIQMFPLFLRCIGQEIRLPLTDV
jgi:hypothetical protein